MSLANEKTKKSYTGNGSTTVFPYDFKVFNKAHMLVLVGSTEQTVDVDYTVTGVGEASGGNVIFTTAPADAASVVLMRDMDAIQETEYTTSGSFPASAHEAALDRLTMLVQQVQEQVDRMPLLPVNIFEAGALNPLVLPTGNGRAIGWNSTGEELQTYPVTTISSAVFDDIGNYSDDLAAAVAAIGATRTTLVIPYDISIITDVSTPKTLRLMPINDAKINILATKTLLVYSPAHFIASPNQQIHGNPVTGGTLAFTKQMGVIEAGWWGLVDDGAWAEGTDNSTALAAALTAAEGPISVDRGGARLHIPGGWYAFTTPLATTGYRNIEIYGDTRESTILDFRGAAGETALSIDGTQDPNLSFYYLHDFALRDAGNSGAGDKDKHGLNLTFVQISKFERMVLRGFDNALVIKGASHINQFSNIYFTLNNTGVSGTSAAGSGNNNSFNDCWFNYNTTSPFNGTYVNYTTFTNCDFEAGNGKMILGNGNNFYGNRLERNTNGITWVQIVGNNNNIDNMLVASSGGFTPTLVFDVDGNYNRIKAYGANAGGGNLIQFNGNHNEFEFNGGILAGHTDYTHILDSGKGNVLKTPWGYVSPGAGRTTNIITAPVINEVLQSSDLSNASWTKTDCTITGLYQIVVDAGPPVSHSVKQSFTADRDFDSVWVGLKHLKQTASGRYLTITISNDTTPDSDATLYIDNNEATYQHFFRVSDIGGDSGDTVTVSLSTANLAANSCYVKEIMVSLDSPAPYTQTQAANAASSEEYPAVSFTWDPGDLADGVGETSSSVNVPGAELGDFVLVSAPYDMQDLIVTAYVQAADVVEVRIQNENAGANVDLASGTWKIKLIKA